MTQLTGLQVYDIAYRALAKAGVDGQHRRDAALTATGISKLESGWRTDARGDTTITTKKWGPSIGLWQIRSLNKEKGTGGTRDEESNLDPLDNADAMVAISSRGTNWQPWSVWKANQPAVKAIAAAIAALDPQTDSPPPEPPADPEPDPAIPETPSEPPAWAANPLARITGPEMADPAGRPMMSPSPSPYATVNRAELATILTRLYDLVLSVPNTTANAAALDVLDAIEVAQKARDDVASLEAAIGDHIDQRLAGTTLRLSTTAQVIEAG